MPPVRGSSVAILPIQRTRWSGSVQKRHTVSGVAAIWTIGYETLLPESLIAELTTAGVQRLIDVRFRPQSRRPGMSKTRLGARLGEASIAYEHRKALGTPPDLRWLYKAGRLEEAVAAYLKALQIDPDYHIAHHNLGVVYRRMGRISESVEHLKKAARLEHARFGREAGAKPRARWGGLVWIALLVLIGYLLLGR